MSWDPWAWSVVALSCSRLLFQTLCTAWSVKVSQIFDTATMKEETHLDRQTGHSYSSHWERNTLKWEIVLKSKIVRKKTKLLNCPEGGRGSYLHSFQGICMTTSLIYEVYMLHIFCYPLKETQGLVDDNGHRNLGQLLHNQRAGSLLRHNTKLTTGNSKNFQNKLWVSLFIVFLKGYLASLEQTSKCCSRKGLEALQNPTCNLK